MFSITPNSDNSRRLIQTAYTCFQQLSECNELNDEQKQWIQTWMDSLNHVSSSLKIKNLYIYMIIFFKGQS